jgi:hypothetical protein
MKTLNSGNASRRAIQKPRLSQGLRSTSSTLFHFLLVLTLSLGTVDGDADVNGDNEEDATDLQRVINDVLGLG